MVVMKNSEHRRGYFLSAKPQKFDKRISCNKNTVTAAITRNLSQEIKQ